MSRVPAFFQAKAPGLRWLACALIAGSFAWSIALMYIPGSGFTYFIEFGEEGHEHYLPELRAISHYEIPDSDGYDAKAYVQIAMRPNLGDRTLRAAVGGLGYRARRILFLWSAWLLGAGKPAWILEVYSLQNVICWFALAVVLLRWFPPVTWGNVVRWGCVLYSFGLIFSVRSALLDGPSLLLIAVGLLLVESGRPWLASAVLGVSGLGKETNVLAGFALATPSGFSVRTLFSYACRWALVVLPLLVWVGCVTVWIGHGADPGAHNFSAPFTGLVGKLRVVLGELRQEPYPFLSAAKFDLLVLVGLLAQLLFFALRPLRGNPWWRLGAAYALLMTVLGPNVWVGYPTAASRVLLPMTLAFNVLVPRSRGWIAILVLGNVGVLGSFNLLHPPPRPSMAISGSDLLKHNASNGRDVSIAFAGSNWRGAERSTFNYWRWSQGDAAIQLFNPQPFSIQADVHMVLRTLADHKLTISSNGNVLWSGTLRKANGVKISLNNLVLKPGTNVLDFRSQGPPAFDARGRPIDFGVWNAVLALDRGLQ